MTDIIIVDEDIHGGSTVAICPPKGIELDDGGWYHPSDAQKWLWSQREKQLKLVAKIVKAEKPKSITYAINGDCVDGAHHLSSNAQYITPLESHHIRIAHAVIDQTKKYFTPNRVHMTRGTGAHTGKASTLEEGLGRVLRQEKWPMVEDPDTGQITSYWRRYEVGGLLIDQRHHGRAGQRAHTRGTYWRLYAQDIEMEHRLDGIRPPDLALRAHNHTYGDSGRDHRWITRVISGPCWQLTTEYSHRRAYESLPSIGMYMVVIRDGRDELFVPALGDLRFRRVRA